MPEIVKDIPLPKTMNEKYGKLIDKMKKEVDSIILLDEERHKVIQHCKRKYGAKREFSVRKVEEKYRLYRTK